ncbi:metal ABC transporter permease [Paracoccus pacificus]|uniref:Metal ABC transporter permease n=1 Tax=Paracoccus pacificus TaxID=1463598 RepID=A0ABW4R601_9RHOB
MDDLTLLDMIIDPFTLPFMRDALLITLMVSVPAAILSCLLVLKGWSLMGDAVSHAILPGVVLAYMTGIPLIVGAFAAGMICSLAAGFLQENSRVKRDTVLGVVMSGMFGLGIVLYTAIRSEVHLDHILFGNMLGVGPRDLLVSGSISVIVTVGLLLSWRDQLLYAFDPIQARVSGLPVAVLHYGLLAALSLTVVAMLTSVGIILAIGLLIAPGATAFLLTRRFGRMMVVSVAVTLASVVAGVWISFWMDSAPAATIILVLSAAFTAAFIYRQAEVRRHGRTPPQQPLPR